MNSLKGHITAIEIQDELSLVRIDVSSISIPQTDLASPALARPAPSSITVTRADVPRSTMAQPGASPDSAATDSGSGDRSPAHILSAIVIETPASADWLRIGHPVTVLFKPTEVMIALPGPLAVSVQNKLPCSITNIKTGTLLCQLELRFEDQSIHSIITRNACEQLALTQGQPVIALIKTNEVSISAHD